MERQRAPTRRTLPPERGPGGGDVETWACVVLEETGVRSKEFTGSGRERYQAANSDFIWIVSSGCKHYFPWM